MKKYRLILLWAAAALLLTGCGSHKRATVRPPHGGVTELPAVGRVPVTGNSSDSNDAELVARIIDGAYSWIGTPYVYGGTTRKGADCSGFLQRLFADIAAVSLPRNSRKQAEYCRKVPDRMLQPGDLVFFDGSRIGSGIAHVGLYVGDGRMIHASSSRGVIVSDIGERYYRERYRRAGRVDAITYAARATRPKGLEHAPVIAPELPVAVAIPVATEEATVEPDGTLVILTDISAKVDSAFAALPDSVFSQWMD